MFIKNNKQKFIKKYCNILQQYDIKKIIRYFE